MLLKRMLSTGTLMSSGMNTSSPFWICATSAWICFWSEISSALGCG